MNNWNNTYAYSWDKPISNIQYCTSLDEALSRCNMRNTEDVFFHQDQPIFYRIKVEQDGRKYWQGFQYGPITQIDNTPVVRQDLKNFDDRLKTIENLLFKGEMKNEQSDGQISISAEFDESNAKSTI